MTTLTRRSVRFMVGTVVVGLAAVLAITLTWRNGGHLEARATSAASRAAPGSEARFVTLSRASSNQCGLQPAGLESLARTDRLQGSCCSRMDFRRYQEQVKGLRRYAHEPLIPADPYDVSAALAVRLVIYQRRITLTPSQQETYDRAVEMSDEGGPCCCHCWRWTAFEGQAKFLITHRGYGAREIADVWELEDGCGGRSDHSQPSAPQS